jgi:hypothetical protein
MSLHEHDIEKNKHETSQLDQDKLTQLLVFFNIQLKVKSNAGAPFRTMAELFILQQ